jgi:PAS domain S-box-containing protein/putative nucleotidyltransferase with HDIG domain
MKDENGLPRNRSGTVPAESNNHKTVVFCRIAYVCFGIQIGLGITALAGWACNFKLLASFRSNYIPMAQNTAIAFIVFGFSSIFLIYWHKYRPFKLFALFTVIFTILIGLFSLFQFSTSNIFYYEYLVFGKKEFLGMVPTGVMSPVTASAFLLAGVSYLLTLIFHSQKTYQTAASILSAIVMIIGTVVILGYLYGTPLLYGGTTVPMALSTAIAFVFLGTGLMVSIGTQCWPFYLVVAPTTGIRITRSFMPIIIAIVLVNGWLVANANMVFPLNPALMSVLLCIVFLVISAYSISKIAKSLGNKIDRTEDNYKHAMMELSTHNKHNKALAELGKSAISNISLSEFMNEVSEALVKIYDVEYSAIVELLPEEKGFLLRAGVGWKEGLVGSAIIDSKNISQEGYTLLSQQPVIVEDLHTEERFKGTPLLLDHGIISGMSVIIPGHNSPFGILAVHTSTQRKFDMSDGNFLQSVAHMLATVIDRSLLLDDLQRVSFAVEQSPVSIIITDSTGNIEYTNPKFQLLTGYTMEEVIGKNSRILKSGETPPEEYKRLWDTITSGNDWRGRFHNKKKNGELYWEDALISPVKNNDGKIVNFIAIKEDISHEVEIEQRRQTQYAVTAILTQATSVEEIASKVIQTICECFRWDFGTLWIVDRQDNVLRSKISWQRPTLDLIAFEAITKEITFKPGIGLPGRVWASSKPLWIMNVIEDKNFPRAKYALKDGLHGACGFPIVYENNVIGVMDFFSRSLKPFDDDMLDMMAAMGHQIGMFLARQQMYEQMEKQLNHISVLMEIDRAIASSLDLKVIGGIFTEKAIKHLQAEAVDILLYNQYAQKFSFLYGSGFLKQKEKQLVLNSSTDLCGKMLLNNESVFISNLLDEDIICTRSQLAQEEGFVSYYGMPITAKGRLIGVIEFFFRRQFKPEFEWVDFTKSLSLQLAIAVDNTLLYEKSQHTQSELLQAYNNTIEGWSYALDLRDNETEGHSRRVTRMTVQIAQRVGMGEEEIAHVYRGALLHDIGKLGIPDNILLKPSPLTEEEWVIMRRHPEDGAQILGQVEGLREMSMIVKHHQEKYDGSGYPAGLKGTDIPLGSRVAAVVDSYDAMTSSRPYRKKAMTPKEAIEELRRCAGTQFDPQIVKAMEELYAEGLL